MVKRLISVFLLVVLAVSLTAVAPLKVNAAMLAAPASVKGVNYKFNDNVKFHDLSQMTRTGGSVRIPGASFKPGDVIIDKKNICSLKVLKINPDGSLLTAQPTMIELFKEFEIPRQVIYPTSGNITEYAVKGISMQEYLSKEKTQSGEGGQKFMSGNMSPVMNKIDQLFNDRGTKVYEYSGEYEFKPFTTDIFSNNAKPVKLYLDGALGVSPGVVADYSLSDGYEFGFVDAAQFVKLNMMFDVTLKEEQYLPIFGVTIGIEGLGSVQLGVFLVVDVKGNITLTVNIQEGVIATASVSGGTSWGFPTSFNVNKSFEHYLGAECDPMGHITAGLYITPLVNLEILDCDVFGAEFRLGFYGYANINENTMNYGVDFVIHAFVEIFDDRTDLLKINIPIIERYKSFREQDDVIFYTSRLCVYQDRINVAALTKRLAGTVAPNAPPFSDKLPFSDRELMVWYYNAGNDPNGGANQNPTYVIPVKTDYNGCIALNFKDLGQYKVPLKKDGKIGPDYLQYIDIQKGDTIIIKAPHGFIGQTDVIRSVTPFGMPKDPEHDTDFWGLSWLRGDFFEDKVEFITMSGPDLTALSVPNTEIDFLPQKRIYYEGPVTVFSTDKNTKVTEKATFNASSNDMNFPVKKIGLAPINSPNSYDIKPENEMRWQINVDGYIYGTFYPKGEGGPETEHKVVVRRSVEDRKAVIEDRSGETIGIQHNIILHAVAVNKGGAKVYVDDGTLEITLGKVPWGYEQTFEKDGCLFQTDLFKFPAAFVGYPNHYEYYTNTNFPVKLYSKNEGGLSINASNNSVLDLKDIPKEGTVSSSHYLWRWEERKPNIPETVSVKQTYTTPTVAPQIVYVERSNIFYKIPEGTDLAPFYGIPIAYTDYNPLAGRSEVPDELMDEEFLKEGFDVYQMRHVISDLDIDGVSLGNPLFNPPQPLQETGEFYTDANAFDIEFQLSRMRDYREVVVSPLDDFVMNINNFGAAVMKNTSVQKKVNIGNFSALPQWSKGYVSAVVNNGIMSMDGKGNFPAGKYTTRAEFCAAIVKSLGLTSSDTIKTGFPFTDIGKSNAYLQQMKIAYQCGIINGRTSGSFAPDQLISRQDAAAMLMRAFRIKNANLIPSNISGGLNSYKDASSVGSYAIGELEQAVALSFFSGDNRGMLSPKNNILNEQTAKIVWEAKLKAVN